MVVVIPSPRHISQPKCGRTKAGKRRQHETLGVIKKGGSMELTHERLNEFLEKIAK
jgi:hypothetical protein